MSKVNRFHYSKKPKKLSPLEEIKVSAESISTEAFNGIEKLKEAVNGLTNLFTKIRDFITSSFNKDELKTNLSNKTVIHALTNKSNYIRLSNNMVYKAPGQKVKTIVLTKVYNNTFKDLIHPFITNTLPEIKNILANYATNHDELKNIRSDSVISKTTMAFYEKYKKEIGECFDPKDPSTTGTFESLYERNTDLEEVVKTLNGLNEEVYKTNIDEVIKMVDVINDSINMISDNIKDSNATVTVSPNVVKQLADSCYVLAAIVEFYSVYLYKLKELTVSVNDTVNALNGL